VAKSREKQIKDIENLFLSLKNLDNQYVLKWVQALDLKPVYEKVRYHG